MVHHGLQSGFQRISSPFGRSNLRMVISWSVNPILIPIGEYPMKSKWWFSDWEYEFMCFMDEFMIFHAIVRIWLGISDLMDLNWMVIEWDFLGIYHGNIKINNSSNLWYNKQNRNITININKNWEYQQKMLKINSQPGW